MLSLNGYQIERNVHWRTVQINYYNILILLLNGVWPDVSSEKKIISIVDYDQDTSNLFYVILSRAFAGYDVKSFNDSASALQHFTENQSAYAMVITDLRMPGMNGLELLSKI